MENIEVKIIEYTSIQHLKSKVAKEGVVIDDDGTVYLGAFIDGNLVGFVGFRLLRETDMRFKSDWVDMNFRRQGIYTKLWEAREHLIQEYSYTLCSAWCTQKSLPTYLKNKFEVQSVNKNGSTFVKRF